jgi:hypothetical protein
LKNASAARILSVSTIALLLATADAGVGGEPDREPRGDERAHGRTDRSTGDSVQLISLSVLRQRLAVVSHRVGGRFATITSRCGNRLVRAMFSR